MKANEPSTVAVLAEKPSVARDIARVLGANTRGEGYLQGNGYVVTWAVGHLVALAQPHEIDPRWRRWSLDLLPILPTHWPLIVHEKTKDQFEVVRKILTSSRVSRIVCATDAGREGELIFRYIYEATGSSKPVSRLWISSLTPDAIRQGFENLRPGSEYDRLADAACGRSRADWLVGMNLSRGYSVVYGEDLSVGRVQTPTLAMVVERELALRSFVPEDYVEVVATFRPNGSAQEESYRANWFRSRTDGSGEKESPGFATRLPADGKEAESIVQRARKGEARVESVTSEKQRMQPPLLYDLTELQRHANRLFGFTAQTTLETAQSLYERHKIISYPRTDSRHLSRDVAGELDRIVQTIRAPYMEGLKPETGQAPLGRRFVDDAKVTDHHAIIPTAIRSNSANLSAEERKIYDLICRRLLMAWQDDNIQSVTTVITAITNGAMVDRYRATGTVVDQTGWKVLDIVTDRKKTNRTRTDDEATEQRLPPDLTKDQLQDVVDVEALKKKTRPPKRFTDATLLTAMETAGKTLDERELSDAMKETGLGTPATRAAIIEVLLKRGYIVRNKKSLEATDKGVRLIDVVHPEVKSPAMTGQWEAYLKRIHQGTSKLAPFLLNIEEYVQEVVAKVDKKVAPTRTTAAVEPSQFTRSNPAAARTIPKTVDGGVSLSDLLQNIFGFSSFRPNQEAVCKAVTEGKDALLVMPTGSGKSLCYQLPGIARGGTTLVVSPLIALMEDQVAKLTERGLVVDRIHSGRDRSASRHVCLDYLAGKLQFLFIAPERLRVPGFPEMLAKRKPTLIAIDEAHCISQWGHDFRPDYRMLGQHLPALRPAPVLAITATATAVVQEDIAEQLGLTEHKHFIHGFRRDNIAIEIVECPPSQRETLAQEILQDRMRRPAIVYTPSRKQAEQLAMVLGRDFPTEAYHAGLDAEHRQRVQHQFLAGELEVIVATIAFGMGIDKPDVRTVIHTALPASVEGYYQEIGRAGRDGLSSRAVLMHSYADRHTHDFFFARDYPEVTFLDQIYAKLTPEAQEKKVLRNALRCEADLFDKALEKLWIHGGALIDFAENVTRGANQWRPSYIQQAGKKSSHVEQMHRFAESNQCRMSALVRHFGDVADSQQSCGLCDFCAPAKCVAQRFRAATDGEQQALFRVLAALKKNDGKSTGKLYSELYSVNEIDRDSFEEVLGAMARAGLLQLVDAVFEKDGKAIPYRKAHLTLTGRQADEQTAIAFVIKDTIAPVERRRRRAAVTGSSPRKPKRISNKHTGDGTGPQNPDTVINSRIEEALRVWRLAEAKRINVPAFRIFNDQALRQMAAIRPTTDRTLLGISGIGANTVRKYGARIFRIINETENRTS
ncbi:MAG TPA: DNA topoisomerase 3 [Bryobacteraceae bacterium]|jgi:DNA topoisomerase-3|nr:DNA topoisomerase 3 [Bryobacteraceae bacterium]